MYEVNRRVWEFPETEDLSTPESSFVAGARLEARGGSDAEGRRLRFGPARDGVDYSTKKPRPEIPAMWTNALIREVWTYENKPYHLKVARVLAEMNRPSGEVDIHQQTVTFDGSRWLCRGSDPGSTLEDARKTFIHKAQFLLEDASCTLVQDRRPPVRPKVDDPEAYLDRFVRFLDQHGEEPKGFVLRALSTHRLVIMGEIHHRPRYWALNASLVDDPRFAETTGTIYLELPQNDQPLVDQFLAARELDSAPVISVLRDLFEMGWPDQPMLDFFVSVWKANQGLPPEKRVRILLVDMQRPWTKIQEPRDWGRYEVDRDQFMTDNILRDLRRKREDKRNALFIVGVGHAMLDLKQIDDIAPVRCAGWYLRQALGADTVFAIFPHQPAMGNAGGTYGRLCLGLFDSAFATLGHRPIAFPISMGPFGEQWFDALPDTRVGNASLYRDGYSAYLCLGPLETETFSPLIPGFYTADHMKEIDRRYRVMNDGKPWHVIFNRKETSPEEFVTWMSNDWGQPRRSWSRLGPLNAWHLGSDWEKQMRASKKREAPKDVALIRHEAGRLFEAFRRVDYDNPGDWRNFPSPDVDYWVSQDAPAWVEWVCRHFKTNAIQSVELGQVVFPADGWPAVPYKLTLQNGGVLAGDLRFEWRPRAQRWEGIEGLDWHLKGTP